MQGCQQQFIYINLLLKEILMTEPFAPEFLIPLNSNNQNINTNIASSNAFIKNKLSLQTCGSSISINQQQKCKNTYKQERKIFMKFLMQYSHQNWIALESTIKEMAKIHESLNLTDLSANITSIKIPNFGKQNFDDSQNKAFGYFCRVWMEEMGYLKQKNKKYIINQSLAHLDSSKLSRVVEFYESLGFKFLQEEERNKFIVETCLNGWQYFIHKMCFIISNA